MNWQSRWLIVLALASSLAACGGGAGESNGGGIDGVADPSVNRINEPILNSDPDPVTTVPAIDQQLRGHLSVVANQVVFINGDRSAPWPGEPEPYNGATIKYFEESGVHIASGGIDADLGKPIPPAVIAPAAPIASFGLRIATDVLNDDTDQPERMSQKVVGRVAMDFIEVANAGGVAAGEQAERVSFVIDKVELETNDQGRLMSASVLEDAKLYFVGASSIGTTVTTDFPVPADAVRLMPLTEVIDNHGDTSSLVLLVDLERAFSNAGNQLSAFHNLDGQFNMHLTFSSAKIVRPEHANADEGPRPRRELVGQSIRIPGHTAVTGGGISGLVLIRRTP